MAIYLLDDTWKVEVFLEPGDREFDDNIRLNIEESCPAEEKVLTADVANLFLTPRQARQLGLALVEAAARSSDMSEEPK
jgi:hypothetical protein